MPCYRPLLGVLETNSKGQRTGIYKIVGSYINNLQTKDPTSIRIPCGHCIGCRLDQSRQWADRMMLEFDVQKKGMFLTLTYDDDHVPLTEDDYGEFGALTLWKPDLQKFFKRLRKAFPENKLRYYAVGEYGSQTFRPHYHVILFGLDPYDLPDLEFYKQNDLKQPMFISRHMDAIWSNGFTTIANISWESCAYCARYVQKKIFAGHELLTDLYGVEKEFSLMSRRPGIGKPYLDAHPELFEWNRQYVDGYERGINIPKYFLKNLELTDPDLYAILKESRLKYAKDKELLKLTETDLGLEEQLLIEENLKLSKSKALKRDMV